MNLLNNFQKNYFNFLLKYNPEVAWGASVNKPASGRCSEHAWCMPEEEQPVEKFVIAFINKLIRFLSVCAVYGTPCI